MKIKVISCTAWLSVIQGQKVGEGAKIGKECLDAESRQRSGRQSPLLENISKSQPLSQVQSERGSYSITGRKYPGRGFLQTHFLGTINRINIHRGPGRSQITFPWKKKGFGVQPLLLPHRQWGLL